MDIINDFRRKKKRQIWSPAAVKHRQDLFLSIIYTFIRPVSNFFHSVTWSLKTNNYHLAIESALSFPLLLGYMTMSSF